MTHVQFVPVIVETPYAGKVPLHLRYLRACMRDCVLRGESPYASHHLLTAPGVLRDELPEERMLGIQAGFVWRALSYKSVFYVDLGWSSGMHLGRDAAATLSHPWEQRTLGPDWLEEQLTREMRGDALMQWFRSVAAP